MATAIERRAKKAKNTPEHAISEGLKAAKDLGLPVHYVVPLLQAKAGHKGEVPGHLSLAALNHTYPDLNGGDLDSQPG